MFVPLRGAPPAGLKGLQLIFKVPRRQAPKAWGGDAGIALGIGAVAGDAEAKAGIGDVHGPRCGGEQGGKAQAQ